MKRKPEYRHAREPSRAKHDWTVWRRRLYGRAVGYAAAIKWLRVDANITQRDLARALGVTTATVCLRESGGRVAIGPELLKLHGAAIRRIQIQRGQRQNVVKLPVREPMRVAAASKKGAAR